MSLFDDHAAFLDLNLFPDPATPASIPISNHLAFHASPMLSPLGGDPPPLPPMSPTHEDFLALTAQMVGGVGGVDASLPMTLCSPSHNAQFAALQHHENHQNAPQAGAGSVPGARARTSRSSSLLRSTSEGTGRQRKGSKSAAKKSGTSKHKQQTTSQQQANATSPPTADKISLSALKISSPTPTKTKAPSTSASATPKAASNAVAAASGGRASTPVSDSEAGHHDEEDDGSDHEIDEQEASYPEGSPEALAAAARKVRNKKACTACYKAKTKCSPHLPCQRCKRLMIKCEPREHRRRKRRTTTKKNHVAGHTHVGQNGFVHGDHCVQASHYISELKNAVAALRNELRTYKLALASALPATLPSTLQPSSTSLPPLRADDLIGAGGKMPGQLVDPAASAPSLTDPLVAYFVSRKRPRGPTAPASAPGPVAQSPTAHDAGLPNSAHTSPFVAGAMQSPFALLPRPDPQANRVQPPRVVSPSLDAAQIAHQQAMIASQQQQLLSMRAGTPTGLHGSMGGVGVGVASPFQLPSYFPNLAALSPAAARGVAPPPGRPHSQSFAGPLRVGSDAAHAAAVANAHAAASAAASASNNAANTTTGGAIPSRPHSTQPSIRGASANGVPGGHTASAPPSGSGLAPLADPKGFATSLSLPPSLQLDSFGAHAKDPFQQQGSSSMTD